MKALFTFLFFNIALACYSQAPLQNSHWDIRLLKPADKPVTLPKDQDNQTKAMELYLNPATKTGIWLNSAISSYSISGNMITLHVSSDKKTIHYKIVESYFLLLWTKDQTYYYGIYKP